MQRVQARTCLGRPCSMMVVLWILGSHIRLVCRLEWLTADPKLGIFPQMSHFATDESFDGDADAD